MIDFESLSDREKDVAMSRGYRFEVGAKNSEGDYWIGFINVPLKEIDPDTYQKVVGGAAKLTWPPIQKLCDQLDEYFSNPKNKILTDIELCTRAFHVDENGNSRVVAELDVKENNSVQGYVMTALRVAKIIPEFLSGSLSVGQTTLHGKLHPSLVVAGSWTPPGRR